MKNNTSFQFLTQQVHNLMRHGNVFETDEDSKSKNVASKMIAISREARSNQRRLLTAFGGTSDSDLLKFNILKVIIILKFIS